MSSLKSTSLWLDSLAVTEPTILVAEDRARANIAAMADKAKSSGVVFRPHFKTHQSGEIGRWFADAGVDCITVSSLPMAQYFAEFGWHDILLAFLVNPRQLPRLAELAGTLDRRGGRLGLTVDSPVTVAAIAEHQGLKADIWLKLDTDYGRTGVWWEDAAALTELYLEAQAAGRSLTVSGLLTHSGQSYHATDRRQLKTIFTDTVGRLQAARQRIASAGAVELRTSLGDTPCCSTMDSLAGVDEIRPGNFVFYDLMQLGLGACGAKDLAAAVACPVVGVYPERCEVVFHGGAVHLAKESLSGPDGKLLYGCLGTARATAKGPLEPGEVLTRVPVVSLSQEHGTARFTPREFAELACDLIPGDLVLVWPVHSCLTCDLHREYRTFTGRTIPRR